MGKQNCRTGMTGRVRAAAESMKIFSKRELFCHVDELKPLSIQEEKSFERTWDDLRKRGEINRMQPECYKYKPNKKPQFSIREKIYRAMHIKGAFCAADLKKLTDADQSYISAIIRKLAKAGWLELTGNKGKHMVFRVKSPNKFYLEFIRKNA